MRALPQVLTEGFEKSFTRIVHLIEIMFDTTRYYTDCDMDIHHNGNIYVSRSIEFDEAKYSLLPKVDNITFEIDNVGLEFSQIVMSQEIRAKDCVIYRAAIGDNLSVIGTTPLFMGYTDRVELDALRARFDIVNDFIKWNTKTPRRTHSSACTWTFKDPDTCRYTGGQTLCDKSWDDCVTRGNTVNFGGFRWIPALEGGQDIYWGKLPDKTTYKTG